MGQGFQRFAFLQVENRHFIGSGRREATRRMPFQTPFVPVDGALPISDRAVPACSYELDEWHSPVDE